ncbi:MAG TPA: helix-turn-helix domain-containing protein [Candidatus Binatia bacterium]|nr:helix-turn-helix domain-containing protein [Candidatus Binatia bacterium]
MPIDAPHAAPETVSTAIRILDVSERLFAERGYAAVSVREIAGKVGLNQASIYNHYPSKQALYEAVLERGLRPIRELLAAGGMSLLTPDEGDVLIERLIDQLYRTPHLPKLVQREMLDDGEYFERLSEQWLRPIYEQGRLAMAAASAQATWREDQLPLLVIAMYHLLFGFFTATSLMRRVIGVEPFTDEMRGVHVQFLKDAVRRLVRTG